MKTYCRVYFSLCQFLTISRRSRTQRKLNPCKKIPDIRYLQLSNCDMNEIILKQCKMLIQLDPTMQLMTHLFCRLSLDDALGAVSHQVPTPSHQSLPQPACSTPMSGRSSSTNSTVVTSPVPYSPRQTDVATDTRVAAREVRQVTEKCTSLLDQVTIYIYCPVNCLLYQKLKENYLS